MRCSAPPTPRCGLWVGGGQNGGLASGENTLHTDWLDAYLAGRSSEAGFLPARACPAYIAVGEGAPQEHGHMAQPIEWWWAVGMNKGKVQ